MSYVGSRDIRYTVVFDGYRGGLSTKDHEDFRRNLKSSVSLDMAVQLDSSIGETTQKSFLANPRNKELLINLLSYALSSNNHNVVRSPRDANTIIVSNVLDFACLGHEVEQIGADTDLLVMLIYMWNEMMGKITMKSEATRKQNEVRRDIEQYSSCMER